MPALLKRGAHVVACGPGVLEPHARLVHHRDRIVGSASLTEVLAGVQGVIHAAGRGTPASVAALDGEIAGSEIQLASVVLEASARAQVGRVVLVSSGGTVYGSSQGLSPLTEGDAAAPCTRYGAVKSMIEQMGLAMTRAGLVSCVVARVSNPYGPGQRNRRGQGLVSTVIDRMVQGATIPIWGDGDTVRDYLYVDDAARGLVAAATLDGGTVCNVSSGVGKSVKQVIGDLERVLQRRAEVIYHRDRDPGVPFNVLSREFLTRQTAWEPLVGWDEGLSRTVAWWTKASVSVRLEEGDFEHERR